MTSYTHRQSAHCESGVVANMLSSRGLAMSEPMAFGLSASLIFAYLPMVKMAGQPMIAYRMLPGSIIRGVSRAIGVEWEDMKFGSADAGMQAMDDALERGEIVGAQTGIYWLPYVPDDMRFHFNAHNLVIVDREGDQYTISDPVFPDLNVCDAASLRKARFAKGVMAPKGRIYWPKSIPDNVDLGPACLRAIRRNAKLIRAPMAPMIGVQGIRMVGRKIRSMEKKQGDGPALRAFLGHIVRMQEEIGTGGAGFRFVYAAFLEEAAELLGDDRLSQASKELTDAGDEWRRFALAAVKMCRDRKPMDGGELQAILNTIADREAAVWKKLRKI
ncbi:BtrH N-terminal domain-containing protein [Henriciella litoralis]|uniref:BtrH N-terminal domain-containing protein n=1 Tax=Henriciella litoralis TaxID=568102 RepID=UPI000A068A12|nr:BtrH N-terminal domain-containing protein [Henriciella litoralis]